MTRPLRTDVAQQPLYARILRLRHLMPGGFLCFVFLEGAVALGILLALAELVSWWGVLVLPATVGAMVKLNDVIAGVLTPPPAPARTSAAGTPRPPGARTPRAEADPAATTTARRPVPGQTVGPVRPSAAIAQTGSGPDQHPPTAGESTTRLPGFVGGGGVPVKRPWAERLEADQQRARHSAARRYE